MFTDSIQQKLIIIGLGSLGLLTYFYNKLQQKNTQLCNMRDIFRQAFQQQKSSSLNNKFQYNKKQISYVCFIGTQIPSLELLKSQYHYQQKLQQNTIISNYINKNKFIQNKMGGDFKLNYKKQTILCKLNNVNIQSSMLKPIIQPVNLFTENKNKPKYNNQNVFLTFNNITKLSIFGKLYFNMQNKQWTIEPVFITENNNISELIFQYYSTKQTYNLIKRVGYIIFGCVVGYFTIIKPVHKLYLKYKQERRFRQVQAENYQQINQHNYTVVIKQQNKLNCQNCRSKNVQIIYQCGHLMLCENCHQRNIFVKQCPFCKKISTKFTKVFMT